MGDPEPITEYTIAMDVLGKSEAFKENKDASVRVEVHRLRKRLADFYQNDGASHRVRIVIPTGHYTPEFILQDSVEGVPEVEELEVIAIPAGPIATVPEALSMTVETPSPPAPVEPLWDTHPISLTPAAAIAASPWRLPWKLAAGVLALAVLLFSIGAIARPPDPFESLWRPIIASPSRVLLCIGDEAGGQHPPADPPIGSMTLLEFHALKSQSVLINDAATMTRFAGLLESKGKAYRVVSQSETTFGDLQSGPSVLIGLANNDWTERLVGKLRFWLEHGREGGKLIIRDREHPERTDWNVDYSAPMMQLTKDYALVMRVLDPKTEQPVISAAGISVFGTLAAGDFLTRADEFRKIENVAPKGWRKMNFEIVLSTDVIRGKSGHADIVAWHFW